MTTQYNPQYDVSGLNAIELCTELSQRRDLEHLYKELPNDFILQPLSGAKKFEITPDMVNENDIRIVIHEPRMIREGLMSVKFQLKGIMDREGNLVPMGKPLARGQSYLTGFNSLNILLTADKLSAVDWELLCRYEQWWAAQDTNELYKGLATRRVYVGAASIKFLFQFNLDIRSRPNGTPCFGISSDLALRDVKLLDFVGLPVRVVGDAKAQRTGSQLIASAAAISLPVRD